MLRKVFILLPGIIFPFTAYAQAPSAAAVRGAFGGRVVQEAARAQVQAQEAAPQALRLRTEATEEGAPPATPKPSLKTSLTAAYIGISSGTRTAYNGAPAVFKGIAFNVSAGAGTLLNQRLYLAGEVFGEGVVNLRSFPNGSNIRFIDSYGFDFIPGALLNDNILGYMRLGGEATNFRSISSQISAWRVGLGAQSNFYKKVDIRAEYIFSYYKRQTNIGKVQVDQFNLGLLYKFL